MKKIWWIILFGALALLVTAVLNLAFALRLLALGMTLLAVLGVALKIVTFRRARRITAPGLLTSMGLSIFVFAIYLLVLGVALPAMLFLLGFFAGFWVGWLWAGTESLLREEDGVKVRGAWLSLLIWAGIFLATQFLTVVTGQVPLGMAILMLLGTGITVGYSLKQLFGYFRLRRIQ